MPMPDWKGQRESKEAKREDSRVLEASSVDSWEIRLRDGGVKGW